MSDLGKPHKNTEQHKAREGDRPLIPTIDITQLPSNNPEGSSQRQARSASESDLSTSSDNQSEQADQSRLHPDDQSGQGRLSRRASSEDLRSLSEEHRRAAEGWASLRVQLASSRPQSREGLAAPSQEPRPEQPPPYPDMLESPAPQHGNDASLNHQQQMDQKTTLDKQRIERTRQWAATQELDVNPIDYDSPLLPGGLDSSLLPGGLYVEDPENPKIWQGNNPSYDQPPPDQPPPPYQLWSEQEKKQPLRRVVSESDLARSGNSNPEEQPLRRLRRPASESDLGRSPVAYDFYAHLENIMRRPRRTLPGEQQPKKPETPPQ